MLMQTAEDPRLAEIARLRAENVALYRAENARMRRRLERREARAVVPVAPVVARPAPILKPSPVPAATPKRTRRASAPATTAGPVEFRVRWAVGVAAGAPCFDPQALRAKPVFGRGGKPKMETFTERNAETGVYERKERQVTRSRAVPLDGILAELQGKRRAQLERRLTRDGLRLTRTEDGYDVWTR